MKRIPITFNFNEKFVLGWLEIADTELARETVQYFIAGDYNFAPAFTKSIDEKLKLEGLALVPIGQIMPPHRRRDAIRKLLQGNSHVE